MQTEHDAHLDLQLERLVDDLIDPRLALLPSLDPYRLLLRIAMQAQDGSQFGVLERAVEAGDVPAAPVRDLEALDPVPGIWRNKGERKEDQRRTRRGRKGEWRRKRTLIA
jgi:hypothetical protein